MTCVVDCSIIVRLLANRPGDDLLRRRLARTVHAPALIDAEVSSVVRGLTITTKPNVRITVDRALEFLTDYAGLRIVRHAMQPLQARVFEMRHNFSAYDAMYVALAESLDLPLLTDDRKFAATPGHTADVHHFPELAPIFTKRIDPQSQKVPAHRGRAVSLAVGPVRSAKGRTVGREMGVSYWNGRA